MNRIFTILCVILLTVCSCHSVPRKNTILVSSYKNRHIEGIKEADYIENDIPSEVYEDFPQGELSIELLCPGLAFLGKRLKVEIVIKNVGNKDLEHIVIRGTSKQKPPYSLHIISAEGDHKMVGNSAIWTIPTLGVGEEQKYSVLVTARSCGKHYFYLAAKAKESKREEAMCGTYWRGCFPSLLLEVIDSVDPLTIGGETTYTIEVTNQGTQMQHNIAIEAVFPSQISPLNATGNTRCFINGKRVTITPYSTLPPKQRLRWQIRAKAVKEGDARLKFYLNSQFTYYISYS